MGEVLVDYCKYYDAAEAAKVYQKSCNYELELMHGLIVNHISTEKQNTPGASN